MTPSNDLGDGRTCNPSSDKRLSLRRRSTPQLGCCGRQIKIKMVDFYHTFDFWALIRIDTVTCMFWYESWICMSWWKRPCIYLLNRGRDGTKNLSRMAIWGGGWAWQQSSASVHRPVSLQSQNHQNYKHCWCFCPSISLYQAPLLVLFFTQPNTSNAMVIWQMYRHP